MTTTNSLESKVSTFLLPLPRFVKYTVASRTELSLTGGHGATDGEESNISACMRSLYYIYIQSKSHILNQILFRSILVFC